MAASSKPGKMVLSRLGERINPPIVDQPGSELKTKYAWTGNQLPVAKCRFHAGTTRARGHPSLSSNRQSAIGNSYGPDLFAAFDLTYEESARPAFSIRVAFARRG
jgi:hypothetical protein